MPSSLQRDEGTSILTANYDGSTLIIEWLYKHKLFLPSPHTSKCTYLSHYTCESTCWHNYFLSCLLVCLCFTSIHYQYPCVLQRSLRFCQWAKWWVVHLYSIFIQSIIAVSCAKQTMQQNRAPKQQLQPNLKRIKIITSQLSFVFIKSHLFKYTEWAWWFSAHHTFIVSYKFTIMDLICTNVNT